MVMKFRHLAWAFLAIPLAYSCSQGGNKQTQNDNDGKNALDTVEQCYTASFEGDSALMNLKIIDSTKVEGELVINYAFKAPNNGIVRGEFKGDTLFVDYSFKTGENPAEYANPLAFLRKDGNLQMGVGQIETAYGRSYFVKDKPINFERGKFNFMPVACK
jgi:hypothetical protein